MLTIVHAEWGRHWSGGTKQVFMLIQNLHQKGVGTWLACASGSAIAERANASQIPTVTFPLRGEYNLQTWLSFARWLKAFAHLSRAPCQIPLVHIHSRRGALPTLLIGRLLKLPTVLHWRVAAPIRMPVRRLVDGVIAISEAAAEHARKAGMADERVFIAMSAIDADAFAPPENARTQTRNQFGLDESEFIVSSAGRIAAGKGHDVLLRSVSLLPSHERPIVLLAGDGSELLRLLQISETLGIAKWVRFLGFQNDVRPVLWASDAFVHVPTYFPEGLSVAVLEAKAAGLPVIATTVGGIPEIVRHNETGLLVPPDDAKALAEAVQKLRNDADLRRRLGEVGQTFVRTHHSITAMIERTLQVYKRVLSLRR